MEYQRFIPGKRQLVSFSSLLLLLGVAEIIASIVVVEDSSGYYIGGWYIGMLCTITGIRGIRLFTMYSVSWLGILCVVTEIACIVGTALLNENYNFVNSLEACAGVSDTQSTSCGSSSFYTCSGNSDYYNQAQACAASYAVDNGADSDACSCVRADDSDCYGYGEMGDCQRFLEDTPASLHSALIIAIFCLIDCTVLCSVVFTSMKYPSYLATDEELEDARIQAERNEHLVATTATVTATTPVQPTIVQADAVVVEPRIEEGNATRSPTVVSNPIVANK